MNVKTTKRCKVCGDVFKLYRTTDKYCSHSCAKQDKKEKPKKANTPIKPVSTKRSKEIKKYCKDRKSFLLKKENQFCPVYLAMLNGFIPASDLPQGKRIHTLKLRIPTTEIHHKAGRRGDFLNLRKYWMGVSRGGHNWIHENPEKAYMLGFLVKSSTVNI